MNTNLKEPKQCPICGKTMPAGALAGLCPVCLLANGAETDGNGDARSTIRIKFEPPSVEAVAKLFPQLEILGLLGAGGMGAVYKARQPVLDRWVALKVLPADGAGGAHFAERFNREARALARLNHPNIVAVHEFGQVDGLHFFLMEFVDGTNLRQLEQAGRLSPREALQLIPQICDALQYAHDEGVVHRDIKPENVLVDRKGRVKIADFGLAKIMGQDPDSHRLTVEGQVMGTPHYMAPEQLERPLSVDHRADIYSLGVVFYELLTGDLPLGKFLPPSRKVEVDVRLDEIVLRALENDPARRYQHASEVKSGVATVVGTPSVADAATMPDFQSPAAAPKSGSRYLRWLGIPTVVERDSEREVNFQGALGVFFVMLMVSALAQQGVRWGTGTEYATTQLGFVTAAMMAIWAIHRTLNQPWDDEPQRAAEGTVVLTPRSRVPYWRDALMLVGLFAIVVGSHYLKTQFSNPRPVVELSDAAARYVAAPNPETGTWSVQLPGGGALELMGISDSGAAPDQWWRPDGSQLTNAAYQVAGLADRPVPTNGVRNDIAFRITGKPPGVDAPVFDCDPAINPEFGGFVKENGRMLSGGWAIRDIWARDARSATLRFGYGLGPWRTVLAYNPQTLTATPIPEAGDPDWLASIRGVSATNGGVQVTAELGPESLSFLDGTDRALTMSPGSHAYNWRLRVVAVNHAGKEIVQESAESNPIPEDGPWTAMMWRFQFPGLNLSAVKEVRIQAEPLYWAEFRNVALKPRGEQAPAASAAFGPPTLLSFDELVDFDTGHTADFPPAEPGSNPFAGIGENILWAQENGFDANAGGGKLELLGVTVAEISDAEWEAMTPNQAEARLAATGTRPHDITPLNADRGTSPAYAFGTREGGVGLLRFVKFHRDSSKFTVQFRNVRPPAGAVRVIQARRDRQTGELVGRLPGQGTVTLVAVRAAGSTTWSRPDGAPAKGVAPQFALDFDHSFATSNVAGRLWQVLLQAKHLPSPEDYVHFEFPGVLDRFFTGGAIVPQVGANPGMVSLHVLWPDSATNATMRVGVPMAPWHPIRSFEPFSRSFTKTSWGDEPKWNIEMHTAGVGTKGAQITVVLGTNYPGWNLRLIASRAGGGDVLGLADASATNGPATTSTYVFPSLTKLDDVQNFQCWGGSKRRLAGEQKETPLPGPSLAEAGA